MSVIRFLFIALFAMSLLATTCAFGDEGMWPLYDLNKLPFDSLKARGLTLTPEQIYNASGTGIANAVVNVGGGTGSFLSSEGLIVTNHHVAFDAIQRQSTVESNYLRDGFYAATRAEEIPAQGYRVWVTLKTQDVTADVLSTIPASASDLERFKAIEKATKRIVKNAEAGRDVKCHVAKVFGGKQYVLFTEFEIKDVRIVYVPPEAIGNYGDEIDNWMWPRHVGDFSFLRAYVAPNGKSAEYAQQNVPYRPKSFLSLSGAGVHEGDFTMMIGFPGSTERYLSSYDVEFQLDYSYPAWIGALQDRLAMYAEMGAKDSTIGLRLASRVAGISNWLKNSLGTLEGFRKSHILETKREMERQLGEFLAQNPALEKRSTHVLAELDSLYRVKKTNEVREFWLGLLAWSGDFPTMAEHIYKQAVEREKPDAEREPGFQDRDTSTNRDWLENAQTNLVPSADRRVLKYTLEHALNLPASQRIAAVDGIIAGKSGIELEKYLESYLDDLFARTSIGDLGSRMKMNQMTKAELEKLNDPLINLAKALKPEQDERRKHDKEFSGAQSRLAPRFIEAIAEWKKGNLYPDANGTMRFNYGSVKGYHPRDAVTYDYLTTLTGVMEKETGEDPFIVPEPLKKAYQAKDYGKYIDARHGDLPVNFLTTNDGTGGSSGSPILNGKGEMIAVNFDGNWEAIASDYLFDPILTRSIVVDARYLLFVIDKVYHLDALLKEMTIR
jgi:hypothetical protein